MIRLWFRDIATKKGLKIDAKDEDEAINLIVSYEAAGWKLICCFGD